MSKPTPLTVFDRRTGQTFQEFLDDSPATYESYPSEARDQRLKAHPLYDWLSAAYFDYGFTSCKCERLERRFRLPLSCTCNFHCLPDLP